MLKENKYSRRHFLGAAAISFGAAELAMIGFGNAQFTDQKQTEVMNTKDETAMPFGPINPPAGRLLPS